MKKDNFTLEDIISEIQNDTLLEMDKTEENKFLNEDAKKRKSFFKSIIMKTIGKLLTPLKIRITIFWNEKEILTYEIPKN